VSPVFVTVKVTVPPPVLTDVGEKDALQENSAYAFGTRLKKIIAYKIIKKGRSLNLGIK
jgi:hypothetical protein